MTPATGRRGDPRERLALLHLESGRHSARTLAVVLGVSRITAFRIVQRLRRRGLRIESVKRGRHWYFEVETRNPPPGQDPLLRRIGFARSRRGRGESVDDAIYGPPA